MGPTAPFPPPELPAAALSTGAVARRLGVSPTTLRSWERRYAIGPAARREGGRHRRWTPGDIARLELMCRLTARGVPPSEAARAALGAAPGAPAVVRATGRFQFPAQCAQSPPHVALDRAQRQPGAVRDLGLAEIPVEGQAQDALLRRRQPGQFAQD